MLWKETQVVWSTYYVLLRTSAFSTDISHRDTPTRLPPFLLGSVSVRSSKRIQRERKRGRI